MKTILLFGTFDGIHEGHRSCFSQARKRADHLIVVVAPDAIVRELKGRPPKKKVGERVGALQREPLVGEVVVGDERLGSYEVLTLVRPDMVGVGYDQHALAENLRAWARIHLPGIKIIRLEPFQPETYKSSKI